MKISEIKLEDIKNEIPLDLLKPMFAKIGVSDTLFDAEVQNALDSTKKELGANKSMDFNIDYSVLVKKVVEFLFERLEEYENTNEPKTKIGKIIKWIVKLFSKS